MNLKRIFPLVGFLAVLFLVQWGGETMTFTSVNDWYVGLKKPSWTPPSWVFGPVWTLLYLTIAFSGWMVWVKARRSKMKTLSLCVYGMQLFANLLWSYFFFFLKSPLMGLVDIVLLAILIAINVALFIKVYRPAGVLLIPYLLWTLYAFSLNLAIWELNR